MHMGKFPQEHSRVVLLVHILLKECIVYQLVRAIKKVALAAREVGIAYEKPSQIIISSYKIREALAVALSTPAKAHLEAFVTCFANGTFIDSKSLETVFFYISFHISFYETENSNCRKWDEYSRKYITLSGTWGRTCNYSEYCHLSCSLGKHNNNVLPQYRKVFRIQNHQVKRFVI